MLVVVMTPGEKWSDERLDDVDKAIDDLTVEMREGFAWVHSDIRELRRTLYVWFFLVIAVTIGSNILF